MILHSALSVMLLPVRNAGSVKSVILVDVMIAHVMMELFVCSRASMRKIELPLPRFVDVALYSLGRALTGLLFTNQISCLEFELLQVKLIRSPRQPVVFTGTIVLLEGTIIIT